MLQVLLPSIEGAIPILPRGKLRHRAARQHSPVELQTLAFPLCSLLRTYPLPSLRALGNSPGTGSRGILPTGPCTACPPFIGVGRRLGIKSRAGLGAQAMEGGRGGGLTPPEDAPGGQQGGWGMGRASVEGKSVGSILPTLSRLCGLGLGTLQPLQACFPSCEKGMLL